MILIREILLLLCRVKCKFTLYLQCKHINFLSIIALYTHYPHPNSFHVKIKAPKFELTIGLSLPP